MADYKLYQGDCLEIMQQIPDKSVDCIICDGFEDGSNEGEYQMILKFEDFLKELRNK